VPGDMAMAIAKSRLQNEARKQQRGCALVFRPNSTPPCLLWQSGSVACTAQKQAPYAPPFFPFLFSFFCLIFLSPPRF